VPKENLLGSADIAPKGGFAGVMQTFDNTRPLVAGMAIGVARACLERTKELLDEAGVVVDYDTPPALQTAAASEYIAMESDWEAAYLLALEAAWMADNKKPNSLQASMAKAKAGRVGTDIALRCVALAGSLGYGEGELLEKWARDVKILDIFEGTQQIQLLIIARQLLGKTSAELR
jgi:acyl-CoA dehydrogenase